LGKNLQKDFVKALDNAQGRSEFVIAAVIDIRGFSRFSKEHESPDIAMFIKRFYLRLIKDYFANATFVKPTGDGLLMTFIYDENSLKEVAKQVIEACVRVLADFPTLCTNDPMINFKPPDAIGIGIARGTACCLFSGEETLDYSGHLLNLASRLNDLARPSGIVVDGSFLESILPDSSRAEFKMQKVFVRSIAEDVPISVFYFEKYVKIPSSALVPLSGETWSSVTREFKYGEIMKMDYRYRVALPSRARDAGAIRATVIAPKRGSKQLNKFLSVKNFDFESEPQQDSVTLHMDKIKAAIVDLKTSQRATLSLRVDFIPKPLVRS